MKLFLFYFCILLEVTTVITLVISHFFSKQRIWPPQNEKSWQQYFMAFLFNSIAFIIILVGLLDWGSSRFPNWSLIPGIFVWVMGLVLSIWAISSLGVKSTFGDQVGLIIQGPYQYSRNPQYIGFVISLFGWILMTRSTFTLTLSLIACIPLIIVPFIEESWLIEKYGKDYEEYMKMAPRFFFKN
jgi:protein-S-isoprenylcysteine O-methyltransferase Ste14